MLLYPQRRKDSSDPGALSLGEKLWLAAQGLPDSGAPGDGVAGQEDQCPTRSLVRLGRGPSGWCGGAQEEQDRGLTWKTVRMAAGKVSKLVVGVSS